MKTLKDILPLEDETFDIYSSRLDTALPAICTPILLTAYAKEKFEEVLSLPIEVGPCQILVKVETQKQDDLLEDFLLAAAGYVSVKEYDRLFIEG